MIERNYHEIGPRGMQGRAAERNPLHQYRHHAKTSTDFPRAQELRGVSGEKRGVRNCEERGVPKNLSLIQSFHKLFAAAK